MEWDTGGHYQITFYFLRLVPEGEVVERRPDSLARDSSGGSNNAGT